MCVIWLHMTMCWICGDIVEVLKTEEQKQSSLKATYSGTQWYNYKSVWVRADRA